MSLIILAVLIDIEEKGGTERVFSASPISYSVEKILRQGKTKYISQAQKNSKGFISIGQKKNRKSIKLV